MSTEPQSSSSMAVEGPIAAWYARITGVDRRRFVDAAKGVAARVPRGGRVLELAPGPGYLAIEIAKLGYRVTGVELSRSLIAIACASAPAAGVTVDVVHGDAAHLPFADASFDHVVCMAALESIADPVGALAEIHRVLVAGARASIHELRRDAARGEATVDDLVAPGRFRSSELVASGTGFELRPM